MRLPGSAPASTSALARLLLCACLHLLVGCSRSTPTTDITAPSSASSPAATPTAAAPSASAPEPTATNPPIPVVLDVVFSSEKKDWAGAEIDAFNASNTRTDDGRPIHVKVTFTGSVEPIDGIVSGAIKPHVFSPASSLVLPLLDDQWTGAKGATSGTVVGDVEPLVLSPVVIAMWEPMARALGWPAHKIRWHDIAALSRSAAGWRDRGHPEWGDFRFGHTHPRYSNSGLIAVLAEIYAGIGKTRDLTTGDVTDPRAKQLLHDVESSVVHYGRSTGFFYDALKDHGPAYLSAAVLYENLVITSTGNAQLPFPLVCIYPEEGTAWADHPYAILNAPWVGPEERDAAKKLRAFLLSKPEQEKAMRDFGFRPALTEVALGAPIDAAHGADPKEPQTLLGAPTVRVTQAVLDTWDQTKRGVDVVVVFDRSGSMAGPRLRGAREGLLAFLDKLRPDDRAELLTFSGVVDPPTPPAAPKALVGPVNGIFADGDTALYDAILRGRDIAQQSAKTDKRHIHAVVVLTDGEDNESHVTLAQLLDKLASAEQSNAVRVFTIGYGGEASGTALKRIAERTGGAYYHGDVDNIRSVYEEIASFF
jgi:Ca-activated chloride channel family protein